MKQRGVNHAYHEAEHGGFSTCDNSLTDLCANDVAKDWKALWRFGWGRGKWPLLVQKLNQTTFALG